MMDFDPFHISTLKSQIASTESALASLQAEIKQKEEEKQRMESQIIKLSENIASKDQTIYDLQTKIQILEQSVMQLTNGAREKEDARKMADFYRDELEKREKEVVLLTRERDMLNWKLIYEGMIPLNYPLSFTIQIESIKTEWFTKSENLPSSSSFAFARVRSGVDLSSSDVPFVSVISVSNQTLFLSSFWSFPLDLSAAANLSK